MSKENAPTDYADMSMSELLKAMIESLDRVVEALNNIDPYLLRMRAKGIMEIKHTEISVDKSSQQSSIPQSLQDE